MLDLLNWYYRNKRNLPWRESKNPYNIWLSEIIMQQTRIDQGLAYYNKFINRFPTVKLLAEADIDEILLMWQGLGYYSRARNLHETAQNISKNYYALFPTSYSELKKLKGVGDYTAAAIASIAYNLPEAVVDGNVYRVLSRYYIDSTPIDTSQGKKLFKKYAQEFIDIKHPGDHNEAMMELGATVCTPTNPTCEACPLAKNCLAYANDSYADFPVKLKTTKQKRRFLNFVVVLNKNKVLIEKRNENDIWKGLYQFPCIESEVQLSVDDTLPLIVKMFNIESSKILVKKVSPIYKHVLSHQILNARFIHLEIPYDNSKYLRIDFPDLKKYGMPRLITRYLEENFSSID